MPGAPRIDPKIFELGIPILGICYGAQLVADELGGEVSRGESGEYGKVQLRIVEAGEIANGVTEDSVVWMSHFDAVMTQT